MPTKPAAKNKKKSSKNQNLSGKYRFSKTTLLVFAVVFAGIGGYFLLRSFAAQPAPSIYLTPAASPYGINTNFSVQVRENSGSTNVNAVQANLSYPTGLLTFVSIDYTGTAFTTGAQSSGGAGVINIGRAVIGGTTGDQLVATINFTTNTTGGAATVAFTSGTAVLNSSTNTDTLGSLSNAYGGTFTVDTVPPTVSITAPTTGSTIALGSTSNVTIASTDASSAVAKVEVYIDGTLKGTITTGTSPYIYPWVTTGYSLGAHTILAKSYDTFNNVASSTTINVTLADQTPPSAPGNFHTTVIGVTTVSLAWNASTDNVGVSSYTLKRGGTVIATIPAATLTYNDSGLAAGTAYTYTIQAVDAASNSSTASSVNATTATVVPGDLNADGHVDSTDLSILVANYNTTNAVADINHDGVVNIIDLSILISNYGT